MKKCSRCKEVKSIDEFNFCTSNKDGLQYVCRDCGKKYDKARQRKGVRRNLWYLYGITGSYYNQLLKQQNEVCAICKKPEEISNQYSVRSLSVDHDHKTNEIRGLLCRNCNTMLGGAKDDINILKRAIEYLEKNNVKTD